MSDEGLEANTARLRAATSPLIEKLEDLGLFDLADELHDIVDAVKAEAWDAGWEIGQVSGHDDYPSEERNLWSKESNPYRADPHT